MRESLGRAMNATDLSPQAHECAVDRLGAMAFGNALGTAMFWATLSGERRNLTSVIGILSARIEGHLLGRTNIPGDCARIAALSILERMYPHCRACNGAGQGKNADGVLIECPICHGSGIHRYSDEERAEFVERSWRPRLARLLSMADAQLSGADIAAIYEVRVQLEKIC